MKNKIIDLFCGAGGLSLGFEKAGFEPIFAIDFWAPAIETFNNNRKNKVGLVKDITTIDDSFLLNYNLDGLTGIVGGPPCQGFSMAGRRIVDDERNKLYRDYFRILEKINPDFFVMENVVGILNINNGAVKEDILRRAKLLGYKMHLKIMCAANYGVPQNRKRAIFVGIKEKLCVDKKFYFPEESDKLITCYEALSDLPKLDVSSDNTKYLDVKLTQYQKKMRGTSKIVYNHEKTNHSKHTIEAIKHVPEGGGMRDLPEHIRGERTYSSLLRRMDRNKPSQTIDTGHRTYFHYEENRIISVREAARLQSFPDNYIFYGSKQHQYKEVGNAVPPLMAFELAKKIKEFLEKE